MSRIYFPVKAYKYLGVTNVHVYETKGIIPFNEGKRLSDPNYFKAKIEDFEKLQRSNKSGSLELTRDEPRSAIQGWMAGRVFTFTQRKETFVTFPRRTDDARISPGLLDTASGRAESGKEEEQRDWGKMAMVQSAEIAMTRVIKGKKVLLVPTYSQRSYWKYKDDVNLETVRRAHDVKLDYAYVQPITVEVIPARYPTDLIVHPYEHPSTLLTRANSVGVHFEPEISNMEIFYYTHARIDSKNHIQFRDTSTLQDLTDLKRETVLFSIRSGYFQIWKGGEMTKEGSNADSYIAHVNSTVPAALRHGHVMNRSSLVVLKQWPDKHLGEAKGLQPLLKYEQEVGDSGRWN